MVRITDSTFRACNGSIGKCKTIDFQKCSLNACRYRAQYRDGHRTGNLRLPVKKFGHFGKTIRLLCQPARNAKRLMNKKLPSVILYRLGNFFFKTNFKLIIQQTSKDQLYNSKNLQILVLFIKTIGYARKPLIQQYVLLSVRN